MKGPGLHHHAVCAVAPLPSKRPTAAGSALRPRRNCAAPRSAAAKEALPRVSAASRALTKVRISAVSMKVWWLVGTKVAPGEQVGCADEVSQQADEARQGVDAGRRRQGAQLRRREVAHLRPAARANLVHDRAPVPGCDVHGRPAPAPRHPHHGVWAMGSRGREVDTTPPMPARASLHVRGAVAQDPDPGRRCAARAQGPPSPTPGRRTDGSSNGDLARTEFAVPVVLQGEEEGHWVSAWANL